MLRCDLGLDLGTDCPVAGGWGMWTPWGPCLGECGREGRRVRTRACDNPRPQRGGEPCVGASSDAEPCELPACTMEQYWYLVSTDPLRRLQFREIRAIQEVHPEVTITCIATQCPFEIVQGMLGKQAMNYWNALLCVKHNVGCPVAGGWGAWTRWSRCSAGCGRGARLRERTCDNPPPTLPQLTCHGRDLERQPCAGSACAARQGGEWSGWSDWSPCSSSCGRGFTSRIRRCGTERANSSGSGPQGWVHSSGSLGTWDSCAGPAEDVDRCYNSACPVDGGWSPWQPWSPCSAPCGLGVQSRGRACSDPAPREGGRPCPGPPAEVRRCFARPCTAASAREVAVLRGDAALLYRARGRPTRLLHLHVRFLPLAPSGTLVHRHAAGGDHVRVALRAGRVLLAVRVAGCSASVLSPRPLQVAEWHEAVATVTGARATLRIDDAAERQTRQLSCRPRVLDLDHATRVGDGFHGLLQLLSVNYRALLLRPHTPEPARAGTSPYEAGGVAYQPADQEEGFVRLGGQAVHLPCPAHASRWRVELVARPGAADGVLLYVPLAARGDCVLATLEAGRAALRVWDGPVRAERLGPREALPGRWLHVTVWRDAGVVMAVDGQVRATLPAPASPLTCHAGALLGDAPRHVKELLRNATGAEAPPPLSGVLASVALDGAALDVAALLSEQLVTGQLSSRSATSTDAYRDVAVTLGRPVTLSCAHGGSERVAWYHLDVPVTQRHALAGARLSLALDPRMPEEGFYSCRREHGRAIVTYGVTVVDSEAEWGQVPTRFATVASAVVCVASLGFTVFAVYTSLTCDCGVHSRLWRWLHCRDASPDKVLANLLGQLRAPEAMTLLRSESAVLSAEARLQRYVLRDMPLPPTPEDSRSKSASEAIRRKDMPSENARDTRIPCEDVPRETSPSEIANIQSKDLTNQEAARELTLNTEIPCETSRGEDVVSKVTRIRARSLARPRKIPSEAAGKRLPSEEAPRRTDPVEESPVPPAQLPARSLSVTSMQVLVGSACPSPRPATVPAESDGPTA
ncbi:uncharacterized protein LOC134543199 isoform X2 [Bacillus rossius redtenbacheri]|uniref:uncharacterized protein LOC134543199 isoform X2 n=1 Tax=Bacillus rossius redtenbacheri TaxID=93214 RepID=UPI002FDE5FC5